MSTGICFILKADKHKSALHKVIPNLRSEPSGKPRDSPRIPWRTWEKAFPSSTHPAPPPARPPPALRFQAPPLEGPSESGSSGPTVPPPTGSSLLPPAASQPAVTCSAPQPRDSNSRKRRCHRRCSWAHASSVFHLRCWQPAGRRPRRLATRSQVPQPRDRAGQAGGGISEQITSAGTQSLPP